MGNEGSIEKFEDLRIWQDSRRFVVEIYRHFSPIKDYSFKDQIQRASVSIINNISEGYERASTQEFIHMLNISKGSAAEVKNMLYLSEDLGYMNKDIAERMRSDVMSIIRGIGALIKHLKVYKQNKPTS